MISCKMSSNSKIQLTLQDKKKIIDIIEARERVGAKPILLKLPKNLTPIEQ